MNIKGLCCSKFPSWSVLLPTWFMRELKGAVYFPGGLPLAERVHNRFGGMHDLAVFCGDTEMRAKKRSGKRKFWLWAGAGFPIFIRLGCGNRKGKVAGYGNQVLSWPHFDTFVYSAHVLGTTSRQGNEACQFYPLSLLRVFVLFRYLVTDGVRERSMERSGVRPKTN